MVTVQRAIEMLGVPTVLITVEPEESAQARPPIALGVAAVIFARGFIAGHSLGRPEDDALQKRIVMDALGLLRDTPRPGEVIQRDYT